MYKILIIEDDLTMAQAIQKEMKMWGNDAQYVQDFKNVLETFAEFDRGGRCKSLPRRISEWPSGKKEK